MLHDHVVVWIDHREAHVQSFARDESDAIHIKAHGEPRKIHHRSGSVGSGKAPEDHEFYSRVADSFAVAHEVLIVGPAQAKHEFLKYLEQHRLPLANRVKGVATADHPTDGQLLELARRFFRAADRLLQPEGSRTA
jgi:stalled ribosome rescue protein Dom34